MIDSVNTFIINHINQLAWITTLLGWLTAPLTVLQKTTMWPVGLFINFLNLIIYYHLAFYDRIGFSIIMMGINLYGWYSWHYVRDKKTPLSVTRVSPLLFLVLMVILSLSSMIMSKVLSLMHSAQPRLSAFYFSLSFIAYWLTARKKLESHLFWMAAGIVSIFIFSKTPVPILGFKQTVYFFISIYSYYKWKQSMLVPPPLHLTS
jgi:nicotinamide mononucleotide transporter